MQCVKLLTVSEEIDMSFKALPKLLVLSALSLGATLGSISFALSAVACPCSEYTQKNVDSVQDPKSISEGKEYSHSAQFKKEFDEAISSAYAACKKHLGEKNVAIVSDVDETLLDNRPYYDKHALHESNSFWAWVREGAAPSLKPTADFLAWARKNGFAIILLTGRHESTRLPTMENLIHNGIAYDALYMRADEEREPAAVVKTRVRDQLTKMGFHIIVNIGDQYSDLVGGNAVDCEKLPNKMYVVK
jgi:predicted secreted acid phosphatase